jgi:SpoVK/Ycf46/Vps4 family AAA+-type ATPase
MKRSFIIFMILILIFSFTGCKKETPEEEAQQPVSEVEENEGPDNDAEKEKNQSETYSEEKDSGDNDTGMELSGLELLKSLTPEPYDNMYVETVTTGYEGVKITTIMYFQGDNYRSEFVMFEGQKQVSIYQADEGVTYQYTEGVPQGIKISDDFDMGEMNMGMDMESPGFDDLYEDAGPDFKATMDEFNGEEVILIENVEWDDQANTMQVKMWYSVKYAYPIKHETYMDGELMISSEVVKLETDMDLEEDIFIPPADVEFMEYSMDSMFEAPSQE